MTKEAKSIAIGVFIALVAFQVFDAVWRKVESEVGLPVLIVLVAVLAAVVYVSGRKGKRWR